MTDSNHISKDYLLVGLFLIVRTWNANYGTKKDAHWKKNPMTFLALKYYFFLHRAFLASYFPFQVLTV